MWVFATNSFVSIVENYNDKDTLLVRGRRECDIKNFLGEEIIPTPILNTPNSDYAYRVILPRYAVARLVSSKILNVNYFNFKDSLDDDSLHDMASEVWGSGYRNLDGRSVWKKQKDWMNSPDEGELV